jgi:hypothetical protein
MQHLRSFAMSIGERYRDLEPDSDLVVPSKTRVVKGYEGWAYAARAADKSLYLAYFEKGCPRSLVHGELPAAVYAAQWFDPRTGEWRNAVDGAVRANNTVEIQLPEFPSEADWCLKLVHSDPVPPLKHF